MAYMKQGGWLSDGDAEGLVYIDTFGEFGEVEAGRYHLYVSYACPFAHRPLLTMQLMGLQNKIGFSSVSPFTYEGSWKFDKDYPDHNLGERCLLDVYKRAKADYSGKITVPVLWDNASNTISSNDSLGISIWLAEAWDSVKESDVDLLPSDQREAILSRCEWINDNINVAVYRAGFSRQQDEYEKSALEVFDTLAALDAELSTKRFIMGNRLTLADVCLFPSLIRFDSVYYIHYKLNKQLLSQFPNLWGYVLDMMQLSACRDTSPQDYFKQHYFSAQTDINPNKIIPIGPTIDWDSEQSAALVAQRQSM